MASADQTTRQLVGAVGRRRRPLHTSCNAEQLLPLHHVMHHPDDALSYPPRQLLKPIALRCARPHNEPRRIGRCLFQYERPCHQWSAAGRRWPANDDEAIRLECQEGRSRPARRDRSCRRRDAEARARYRKRLPVPGYQNVVAVPPGATAAAAARWARRQIAFSSCRLTNAPPGLMNSQ